MLGCDLEERRPDRIAWDTSEQWPWLSQVAELSYNIVQFSLHSNDRASSHPLYWWLWVYLQANHMLSGLVPGTAEEMRRMIWDIRSSSNDNKGTATLNYSIKLWAALRLWNLKENYPMALDWQLPGFDSDILHNMQPLCVAYTKNRRTLSSSIKLISLCFSCTQMVCACWIRCNAWFLIVALHV